MVQLLDTEDSAVAHKGSIYEKKKKIINDHMKKLGFKLMGQGVDAQVFGKRQGPVIKVIIPESGNYESADNVFLSFHNYCQKNINNPHLPKFKNVQGKLELVGESFRQIEMERLREIDPGSDLDNMIFSMVRRIEENKPPDPQRKGPQSKNYMSFYKTLKEVMTLGKKLKFQNDIIDFNHSNVMQRNGVPVIMDPWVK